MLFPSDLDLQFLMSVWMLLRQILYLLFLAQGLAGDIWHIIDSSARGKQSMRLSHSDVSLSRSPPTPFHSV